MVSKSSYFSLVIEEYDKLNNRHITELDLNNYLKDNEVILFYTFIKHDRDISIESGEYERIHYHVVIVLQNPYSKRTVINDIAKKLLINTNCISTRRIKDFVLAVQYLIHKNDKEKYQYDLLDIWTNDTNELMEILYDGTSQYAVDIKYLIELVKYSSTLATIYQELGIKKARTYRSLILDLWKNKMDL